MAKARNYVGRQVTIPEGTKVRVRGRTVTRRAESVVTVRAQEETRAGRTRITWKSHGYAASALI